METEFKNLARLLRGEIHFDDVTRKIYSIDASIFQLEPLAVVLPRNEEDILSTLELARSQGIPVTIRGAATGITGACLGEGIIIDTSKYMQRIIEINADEGYAICQPGVIQNQLNTAASAYGLILGPDTSTGDRATVGGMVGNNSAGAHSIRFGKMSEHVMAVDLLTMAGEKICFSSLDQSQLTRFCSSSGDQGRIHRFIRDRLLASQELIYKKFPKLQRRVSGYNLNAVSHGLPFNSAALICGSEGSLGIASDIKVKLVKAANAKVLCLLQFDSFKEAFDLVEEVLSFLPYSVEMMDRRILKAALDSPSTKAFTHWIEGLPNLVFCIEFDGDSKKEALKKGRDFAERFSVFSKYHGRVLTETTEQKQVWKVRKAGLGLLMSARTYKRAVAFLEDVAVPPKKLSEFVQEFEGLLKEFGCEAGIYGHAGAGCLHIRPMIDLRHQSEVDKIQNMMLRTASILKKYSGSMSGEHGDGRIRSWLNREMFGNDIYELFCETKEVFDPENLMNPGNVIADKMPIEKIKARGTIKLKSPRTFYSFGDNEDWGFAVDMCNGNGSCRSRENSLMCPSFNAYGDERHSTRARAQTLHAYFSGKLVGKSLDDPEIYDILDLCIECKGCKSQCPSMVDMAKMKSEYLWHYHKKNGVPWRSKMFSSIDSSAKLASLWPDLSNSILQSSPAKALLEKMGISSHRNLPLYAPKRFSKLMPMQKQNHNNEVVLLGDCYTEFHYPQQGMATVEVLKKLGWNVTLAPFKCCGRPAISKGLLEEARNKASELLKSLQPHVDKGHYIIGLEPGCLGALTDEFPDLCESRDFSKLADSCLSLDDFLAQELKDDTFDFEHLKIQAAYHVHCHQKSLSGSGSTAKVLKKVGIGCREIDAGCCGMAGTFGYEKEHHQFSQAIAESRFYPAIRALSDDTIIIANGMSCRSQMQYGTARKGIHLAELLASCIKEEDHDNKR